METADRVDANRSNVLPEPDGGAASRSLLFLGVAAGPLYVVVGLGQILAREGFEVRRHALSLLSNGDHGWIQIANFLLTGLLVIGGAVGCRRTIGSTKVGTWGPLLLAAYGVGLLGAGVFPADPGRGFPPGVEAPAVMTSSGLLHFVFGGFGFYALIAACIVFARRFGQMGRRGLAWFSLLTGLGFFAAFAGVASGSTSPAVMVTFYVAVLWIWAWHTVLYVQFVHRGRRMAASPS